MGTFGSSKVAKNTTNLDSRQTDAKVAAENSSVITAGAGKLDIHSTDNSGAIQTRGNVNISSVDPGSFKLASDVASAAIDSASRSQAAALGLAQGATTDAQKLAQGGPIGTDWKGLLLPLAVVGAVLALIFLPHKGRA